jgi:hypothetical protein
MARATGGGRIFADDLDRKRWLKTLSGAAERTGWRIHAYMLTGNYFHLLLKTPEANLGAGMELLPSPSTPNATIRGMRGRRPTAAGQGEAVAGEVEPVKLPQTANGMGAKQLLA